MMIDYLQIEGYRSIKSQRVELHPMNVLLGANGVGKSNFLSVFSFFRMLIQSREWEYAAASKAAHTLYMGRAVTDKVKLQFHYVGSWIDGLEIVLKDVDNTLRVRSMQIEEHGGIEEKSRGELLRSLVDQYWVHHFPNTSEKSPYRSANLINDNRLLRADGSNLAAVLYRIRLTDDVRFRMIEDYIRGMVPSFGYFNLMPSGIDESEIHLQWYPKGREDVLFDERHLSDGTLRMISLVTLLLQPVMPDLVLIDEPEIGLHPAAITMIGDLLKKAAQKTQVIISTQSIDMVNQFLPNDVLVCDYKESQSQYRRLNSAELEQWIEEYTIGEMWEKNIFGGQPY